MPQQFKVLEVQGRREWVGGPNKSPFVDWEIKVQDESGQELELVTTRIPTSPAPIYSDVIFGDILPPKFEGGRPKLKKVQGNQPNQSSTSGAQASTGGWQQQATTSPATVQMTGTTSGDWSPDRQERYDAKQNSIIRQHSQEQAIRLLDATGMLQGADLNDAKTCNAVCNLVFQITDRFDIDAKREVNVNQVKQAFPGTTEVTPSYSPAENTQAPTDDIPVGL